MQGRFQLLLTPGAFTACPRSGHLWGRGGQKSRRNEGRFGGGGGGDDGDGALQSYDLTVPPAPSWASWVETDCVGAAGSRQIFTAEGVGEQLCWCCRHLNSSEFHSTYCTDSVLHSHTWSVQEAWMHNTQQRTVVSQFKYSQAVNCTDGFRAEEAALLNSCC